MKISKDDILKVTWDKGFELARITEVQEAKTGIILKRYNPPLQVDGKSFGWGIELWECDLNGKPKKPMADSFGKWRVLYPPHFEEAEMREKFQRCSESRADYEARMRELCNPKPPATFEEQLKVAKENAAHDAQWKTIAKVYPKTVALKAKEAKAPKSKLAVIKEQVLEAYMRETAAATGGIVEPTDDPRKIAALAKALKRKRRRRDPVDDELALNWVTKGYYKMNSKKLAGAIFKLTGKRLSPKTLKQRRLRLGLHTTAPVGHPKIS